MLTARQYQNSVEDLLGVDFDVTAKLPANSHIDFYANQIFTPIGETYFNAYLEVAESISNWAVTGQFKNQLNCDSYSNCQRAFIDDFLPKVFRRPLNTVESNAFATLFSNTLSAGEIDEALNLGLKAALTSPGFLYRTELGGPLVTEPAFDYDGSGYDPVEPITYRTAGGNIESNNHRKYVNFAFYPEGTLVQIDIKAVPLDDVWPEMNVDLGGRRTNITVDKTEASYKLYVENQSGYKNIVIGMNNPGRTGEVVRKLYDLRITVSKAEEVAAQTPAPVLDDDVLELNPYEMASFLSYTYAGTTPDDELLTAAEKNELRSDDQIITQIDRLLDSPRGQARLGEFVTSWLRINDIAEHAKDADIFPEYNDTVRDDMMQELRIFYARTVLDEDFATLFNANFSYLNRNLSDFYNEGNVSGDEFIKTTTQNRGGLLTSGAFLTRNGSFDSTHLIRRSVAVRERVLCHHLPPPPTNIDDQRADAENGVSEKWESGTITNRERTNLLTNSGVCAACHEEIINPLGHVMEDFDSVGRFRSEDHHGLSIDANGTLFGVEEALGNGIMEFSGAKGLTDAVPSLPTAESCYIANKFRFVVGHGLDVIDPTTPELGELSQEELDDYQCAAEELMFTLQNAQGKPRELLRKLGTLDLIRYRKQRAH